MPESKNTPLLVNTYDEVLRRIEKLDPTDRINLITDFVTLGKSGNMSFVMYADHYLAGEFLEFGRGTVKGLEEYWEGDTKAIELVRKQ